MHHTLGGVTYSSSPLRIGGAFIIRRSAHTDERGVFDRLHDPALLAAVAGFQLEAMQVALVQNPAQGTLRGLHYQTAPMQEAKLVTCLQGEVLDVLLDLRADSPSWGKAAAVVLSAADRRSVLVPPGCAHGYITLKPYTWVQYTTDAPYSPQHAQGLHWSCAGPVWGNWTSAGPAYISERDKGLPAPPPAELPRLQLAQ